jgi:protein O-GlcNAc transferase
MNQFHARAKRTYTIAELLPLANALHKQGRIAEAEAAYRAVLKASPGHPDALHLLGVAAHQSGAHDRAVKLIQRAIVQVPRYHQAYNNLGNALSALGRYEDALTAYQKAVEISPEYADAHFNLGICQRNRRRPEASRDAFAECVRLAPRRADAHFEHGNMCELLGERMNAQISYRVALDINPTHAGARINLGHILYAMGKSELATAEFRAALAHDPNNVAALNGLGSSLKRMGVFDEALETLQRALEMDPNNTETLNNLASVHQSIGNIDAASDYFSRVLAIAPNVECAERGLLFVSLNRPELTSDDLYDLHLRLRSRHNRPDVHGKQFANRTRESERRLRVGYVSSDFRTHVVALNALPLIANHDHERFEIFLYAHEKNVDAMTKAFRDCADHYIPITHLNDSEAADLIECDRIDILVTLAGRFDENRPLISTYRPAPIQVSFHDCATSGLEAMDYWLTDSILHPADTIERFTERLYRLPVYYQYPIQQGLPPTAEPPALSNGFVTFGCFNKPEKLNDRVIELWSEILRAVPDAKLLLKYFNHYSETSMQKRWIARFADHGIGAERLMLKAKNESRTQHLSLYNQIDIALDPFPFNGATTTFEALCMGVPVIALSGHHFVDRVAASMVTHAGFPELVAKDRPNYVSLAAELAGDLDRLSALRSAIRYRLHASPLCDGVTYARSVEAAYRDMWQTWVETGGYRGK